MNEASRVTPTEKLFYRPIEASIRWSNLTAHESVILEFAWGHPDRLSNEFPQWPCLHANFWKILDAIRNREIPYGALGITVTPGTPVDFRLLTIRHSDLKRWMSMYHPDQRPSFLFGPPLISQETIHNHTYLILQADRDALQVQLKASDAKLQTLTDELKAAGLEREQLRELAENKLQLSEDSKETLLNIIGALVETILGSTSTGRRHSVFDSQASLVDSITAHYGGVKGLSKRTLDGKFAAGRRNLAKAKK